MMVMFLYACHLSGLTNMTLDTWIFNWSCAHDNGDKLRREQELHII